MIDITKQLATKIQEASGIELVLSHTVGHVVSTQDKGGDSVLDVVGVRPVPDGFLSFRLQVTDPKDLRQSAQIASNTIKQHQATAFEVELVDYKKRIYEIRLYQK